MKQTVLVLGGYGFFGQRISTALASSESLRVLIAGRDLRRATNTALAIGLSPEQAVFLDAAKPDLAAALRRLRVNVLIHTAGPFQGQDYAVARAAIEARSHYIDLSDGRQFVAGISSVGSLASAAGVAVISGASSVPALSSAVVERYVPRFRRLESIQIGISSGARAPGLATVSGSSATAASRSDHGGTELGSTPMDGSISAGTAFRSHWVIDGSVAAMFPTSSSFPTGIQRFEPYRFRQVLRATWAICLYGVWLVS